MKLKKMENPDDILKDHDDSDIIVQQKIDGFKTQAIKDKALRAPGIPTPTRPS